MSDGWIKLHRCLLNKAIWKCTTMEQKTILVTLLLMASHKDNQWLWKGEKFTVKPGQFITSLQSISEAAGQGISIKNVRTALEKFEKLEFLANQSAKSGRLITIINWKTYQSQTDEGGKQDGKEVANDRQRGGKEVATIKNVENERMEENTSCPTAKPSDDIDVKKTSKSSKPKPPPYSKEFESFWSAYPKKVGKDAAWRAWRNRNGTRPDMSVLLGAVEASKMTDQWQRDNGQYIPNPSTWINQGRWNDEACAASDPYAAFLAGEIRQ